MTNVIQQDEYQIPITNGGAAAQPAPAPAPQPIQIQQSDDAPKHDKNRLTVTLGGRRYEIARKHIKEAAAWREKFKNEFGLMIGVFEIAQTYTAKNESIGQSMEKMGLGEAAGIAKNFTSLFLNSMDTVLAMVYSYAPSLEADKDYIESNAYDEDIVDIFIKILLMAYPAGKLTALISGAIARGTGKK